MRFCVRWMGNCRDIGDQQELEPPPDVPPNEVRDKKRLRRPKIRPQRWPRKIKRRPEIKGDVCVEMKFAPPTFFLSSVPFRETTPILQNRKKKPTFPGKLSTKDWKMRLLFSKGWGQSVKLGPHSAIWGKLGTALQAYALNPCTKFPPNPTSRKVNT